MHPLLSRSRAVDFAVFTLLVAVFVLACGPGSPEATPTVAEVQAPVQTRVPTPTRAPAQTAVPAQPAAQPTPSSTAAAQAPTATTLPVPTVSPVLSLIRADPKTNLQVFLRAIPTSERTCLESAFQADLARVLTTEQPLTAQEKAKISGCFGEETARRLMLGQALPDPISTQTIACMSDKTKSSSYRQLLVASDVLGPEIMPLFRAMVTCMTAEEFARSTLNEGGQGAPAQAALACLFTNGTDQTLANLFATAQDPTAQAPADVLQLGMTCSSAAGTASPVSSVETQCLINRVGEHAIKEIAAGVRAPSQAEIAAAQACGLPVSDVQAAPPSPQSTGFVSAQGLCFSDTLAGKPIPDRYRPNMPPTEYLLRQMNDYFTTLYGRAPTQAELTKIMDCWVFDRYTPPIEGIQLPELKGQALVDRIKKCMDARWLANMGPGFQLGVCPGI